MKKVFPELTTPRLVLRALEVQDAPRYFELLGDEEVSRYLIIDMVKNTKQAQRKYMKAFLSGNRLHWAICEKGGSEWIGVISLDSWGYKNASPGYWLSREYRGRGYMTEALQAVLRYGFTEMGLNRICCEYYHDNEASGRVMQKCGLQYEGTQRQKVFLHGKFVDSHMYAILREEYIHSDYDTVV